MEIVGDKRELYQIMDKYDKCIIYGAGLVGSCLIQYLIKEKMSSKVICVAVNRIGDNPDAIMGIPVYEISELRDYKDDYLVIIATLEHLHKEISDELKLLDYRHCCAISNLLYADIRTYINDFTPDIMRKLDFIYEKLCKKIDDAVCRIEEQNEISVTNTKAFAQYKNCFYGRDVVIVATGPTLNYYKPIKDAIHIGVNIAYKFPDLNLDYLFVVDGRSYLLDSKFKGLKGMTCKVFIGRFLNCPYGDIEFPEEYRFQENVSDFILDYRVPTSETKIYRDICNHRVSGWVSVVFSALHFALYTYPRKIFLVGCDTSSDGYFDGTVYGRENVPDSVIKMQFKGFNMMKNFARIHYPETEIISINPVGLKGMFKDIYTK